MATLMDSSEQDPVPSQRVLLDSAAQTELLEGGDWVSVDSSGQSPEQNSIWDKMVHHKYL